MEKGDRVLLLTNYKTDNLNINSGTVVTIIDIFDEVAMVHFKNGDSDFVGINIKELIKITDGDLYGLIADNHVFPSFRTGKKLFLEHAIKSYSYGEIFTIKSISLSINQKNDVYLLEDSEGKEIHLKWENINHVMIPYSEEFESQLGDELKLDGEKNYHQLAARMKSPEGKVVILIEKLEDDYFNTYENNMGIVKYHKNELTPFDNSNGALYEYNIEYIVPKKYHAGNKFVAIKEIEKNVLLNQYIKENDIIEIVNHGEVNIDFHSDIYSVRLGDNLMNLSVYELENFFKSEEEIMIEKKVPGKIVSVEENISEEKAVKEIGEIFNSLPEIAKIFKSSNEKEKCKVCIHDVTINGFNFNIDSNIKINNRINVKEIDKFIIALQRLKTLLEDN